jgi:O-antigen/teichoic acid export membrane protein
VNYQSTLAYHAPPLVVPVIVLNHVAAETNANFYVAWAVTSVVCLVSEAIGQVLLVEGDRTGSDVSSQARLALVLSVGAAALATVGAWFGRDLVTIAYGDGYGEAARLMPLLLLAAVPWAVTSIALFEARVRHHTVPSVAIPLVLGGAIVGLTAVLVPVDGVDGAVRAWLVGNLLALGVAGLVSLRYRSAARVSAGLDVALLGRRSTTSAKTSS